MTETAQTEAIKLDDDTKAKIKSQVEFYFSDSNLPKDIFLRKQITAHPDGWVDLSVVAAFARMRKLLNLDDKTTPETVKDEVVVAVADALRSSDLVEPSTDGFQLRRKQPLGNVEEIVAAIDARTLYARPFPFDADIDRVAAVFGAHATVKCVRLRRHPKSKTFKGSVFVELGSVEEMEKVLAMQLEFDGAQLQLEKKGEYMERKKKERKDKAEGKEVEHPEGAESDGEEAEDDAPAPKKRGSTAQAANGTSLKRKAEGEADAEGEGEEVPAEEEEAEPVYEAGALLQFELEGETGNVDHRLVSEGMGGREVVKFVEYSKGEAKGVLRYFDSEGASTALEEFNAKPEEQRLIAGCKAKLTKLEGDEEKEYYKRAEANRKKRQEDGGGRWRGRGGRGRGRGRGGFRGGRGKRGRN